jgi:serine/threonine kinase 16
VLSELTTAQDQQSQLQDPAVAGRGKHAARITEALLTDHAQGGFSYVYLVQDNSNQQLLALKKIRCPFGQESVSLALKEVEAYTLFSPHPNIIHSIDYSVETDKSDPSAKTVYILLPYYRRGNLQDMINANLVNHTKFPEKRLMVLFLGVCKALKAMHQYKVEGGPGGAKSDSKAKKVRREAARADAEAAQSMEMRPSRRHHENDDEDDEQAEGLLEESNVTMAQEGIAPGGERAYAHRDIKPGMYQRFQSHTQRANKRRKHHDRR